MIRQRLQTRIEHNAVIDTGPVSLDGCTALVDSSGGLVVVFDFADEAGATPIELLRFNRHETQKIRAVLSHTS